MMHELETLLTRLKMEHLGYHVENLLEQAAKEELNYREFLCLALTQEWNGRHQRGVSVQAEAGPTIVGQDPGAVRLYLPAGHRPQGGPGTGRAGVRGAQRECDPAGSTWSRENTPRCCAGREGGRCRSSRSVHAAG